jgi:hypothetical protein
MQSFEAHPSGDMSWTKSLSPDTFWQHAVPGLDSHDTQALPTPCSEEEVWFAGVIPEKIGAQMKELRTMVSDEEFTELEQLAEVLGVSAEELFKRSVAAYVAQVKGGAGEEPAFEPIDLGMWANRPDMQDAAKWVTELRHREWTR